MNNLAPKTEEGLYVGPNKQKLDFLENGYNEFD
jgi:hypothetical protein